MLSRYFPEEVVRFTAKTGFLSKPFWEEFFFTGGQARWRHQAWADLARRGYLVPHSYQRLSNVYVLNRRNREAMGFVGGRAARPPAVAQIDHDEILNRGLMRLERTKALSQWSAEAELKADGCGPHRIETQGRLIKFPDAMVRTGDARHEAPIAIELEKTLKNKARYGQIMMAYAAMRGVRGILFVCGSVAIERAVVEALEAAYFPTDRVAFGLARIEDWQSDPLRMEIRTGKARMRWPEFAALHSNCAPCRPSVA